MGTLASIIGSISSHVVQALADASYPPLVDGSISVGTAAEYEQLAPPRIIFDPSPGFKLVAPEYYSGSTVVHTDERAVQGALRSIAGDNVMFAVHCWGAAGTTNPVDDYDVTRALVHSVRAALQHLMPGAYAIEESGKYRTGGNLVRLGRWATFGLTIYTPVLETLLPYDRALAYASDTVGRTGTEHMVTPDGTGANEPGCT